MVKSLKSKPSSSIGWPRCSSYLQFGRQHSVLLRKELHQQTVLSVWYLEAPLHYIVLVRSPVCSFGLSGSWLSEETVQILISITIITINNDDNRERSFIFNKNNPSTSLLNILIHIFSLMYWVTIYKLI